MSIATLSHASPSWLSSVLPKAQPRNLLVGGALLLMISYACWRLLSWSRSSALPPLKSRELGTIKEIGDLRVKMNRFCFAHIFAESIVDTKGNLAAAPLSIYMVAALVSLIEDNQTALERDLSLPQQVDCTELLDKLHTSMEHISSVTKFLFVKTQNPKVNLDECLQSAQETFAEDQVKVISLEASNPVELANRWICQQTQIRDLFKAGAFDNLEYAVANTLTLDVKWRQRFTHTEPGSFTDIDGTSCEVHMMHLTGRLHYYRHTDDDVPPYQIVSLPFGKKDRDDNSAISSHIVILPDEGRYAELLRHFCQNPDRFSHDLNKLKSQQIKLQLPSYKIEKQYKAVGKDSFSTLTCFQDENLQVIHQVSIEVSQKGIKASAATAATKTRGGGLVPDNHIELTVDRPFLVIIIDRGIPVFATGICRADLLNTGSLSDPYA